MIEGAKLVPFEPVGQAVRIGVLILMVVLCHHRLVFIHGQRYLAQSDPLGVCLPGTIYFPVGKIVPVGQPVQIGTGVTGIGLRESFRGCKQPGGIARYRGFRTSKIGKHQARPADARPALQKIIGNDCTETKLSFLAHQ